MTLRVIGQEAMKTCRVAEGRASEREAHICLKHISLTSQYFLESTLPISESHIPV